MKRKSFLFVSLLAAALSLSACDNQASVESRPIEGTSEPTISSVEPSSINNSSEVINSSAPITSSEPAPISSNSGSSQGPSSSQQGPSSSQQGNSSQSSNSDSQPPVVTTKYYIGYGDQIIPMVDSTNPLGQDQLAEYKVELGNITKGYPIYALDEHKTSIVSGIKAESGDNNLVNVTGGGAFLIHNDAENAFALLKVYADCLDLYVSGYVQEETTVVYKVLGLNNQWDYQAGDIIMQDATIPEEVAQGYYKEQFKASFRVARNDEFKIYDGRTWFGHSALEDNSFFEGTDDGNIKAKYNGLVDLYLKIFEDDAGVYYRIAINFVKDAALNDYYVQYDGNNIPAVRETDATLAEDQVAQYKATIGKVELNKSIAILDEDEIALGRDKYNADPVEGNNVKGEVGNYVIHNDADDAVVTIKVWNSGWVNFFVSGYVADPAYEPVFKVLGINNKWDYAESTIGFVDASNPEEVGDKYLKQEFATFHIEQDEEFLIGDGANILLGFDILELNNHFVQGENNNIKALYAGTVNLYLKTYKDAYGIYIGFTSDNPIPVTYPDYKIVGLNGDWDYENGLYMNEANVEAEIERGDYDYQVKAEFTVLANDEFKVCDGEHYYGGDIMNCNYGIDVDLTNGNIIAAYTGTVELYFKVKAGNYSIYINFTREPSVYDFLVQYGMDLYPAEEDDGAELAKGQIAQYKAVIGDVIADGYIAILNGYEEPLTTNYNCGSLENNNVKGDVGDYSILKDASDVYVLIKVWDDGWINFFVSGNEPEPTPETIYKVVGLLGEWDYAECLTVLADDTDPEEVALGYYDTQLKAEFNVSAGDIFKIHDGADAWFGYEKLEEASKFNFNTDADTNIIAKYDGEVTLYLKFKGEGVSIAINFVREEAECAFYLFYDGTYYAASLDESAELATDQVYEYKVELAEVETGKQVALYNGYKEALTSAQYNMGEFDNNNVQLYLDNYYILDSASDVTVSIKVWSSGFVNFFISGKEPAPAPVYKVVGLNGDWAYANGLELVDDTDPFDVENGDYKIRLFAEFDVTAGEEFKVSDGTLYFGDEEFTNKQGDEFQTNFDGNIIAHYNGTVDLMFLIKEDGTKNIIIKFTKATEPEPELEYRIVGIGDGVEAWQYANSTLVLDDVTDPDLVAAESYLHQYGITFEIEAGQKFKICDGTNWYGNEKFTANENFTSDSDGNIVARYTGTVDIFFTFYLDGSIEIEVSDFVKPAPIEPEPTETVTITLSVEYGASSGQRIYLIGDFCNWDPADEKAIAFNWNEGNIWTATIEVPSNFSCECKLVVDSWDNPDAGTAHWEGGNNRMFAVAAEMEGQTIVLSWQVD